MGEEGDMLLNSAPPSARPSEGVEGTEVEAAEKDDEEERKGTESPIEGEEAARTTAGDTGICVSVSLSGCS